MQNRRRFPRVNYPCRVVIATEGKTEEFTLHTENISSGGVRVIMQKKLQINTPVNVEISVGDKQVKCRGRAVWILDIHAPGADKPTLFDTGIEFTQANPEDKDYLNSLIEKLQEESK